MRLRGGLEAREEVLAIRQLDDDGVAFLPRLRGITS